jgi:hypothetical protein
MRVPHDLTKELWMALAATVDRAARQDIARSFLTTRPTSPSPITDTAMSNSKAGNIRSYGSPHFQRSLLVSADGVAAH